MNTRTFSGMSDSDETLPPSDVDERQCYSPDLFDDNDTIGMCYFFKLVTLIIIQQSHTKTDIKFVVLITPQIYYPCLYGFVGLQFQA